MGIIDWAMMFVSICGGGAILVALIISSVLSAPAREMDRETSKLAKRLGYHG